MDVVEGDSVGRNVRVKNDTHAAPVMTKYLPGGGDD